MASYTPNQGNFVSSQTHHLADEDASATPAVRFKSTIEEFEPTQQGSASEVNAKQQLSGEEEAEIRALSSSLNGSHIQQGRMSRFAFEPVSLPVSRVNSHEEQSHDTSRENTHLSSGRGSPTGKMHTPPLTPAASQSKDGHDIARGPPLQKVDAEGKDGPQMSPPYTSQSSAENLSASRPGSSSNISTRPTAVSGDSETAQARSGFSIGPRAGGSVPGSRDVSPSREGMSTYSRPITPAGDINDPYSASRRPPPSRNLNSIEPRFVFSGRSSKGRHSPNSSSTNLSKSGKSPSDLAAERRHSGGGILHVAKKDPSLSHLHDESASTINSKHGSMAELKRFLKLGGHHKAKRAASPTPTKGTKTPPHHKTPQQLPFGDDHGLNAKYGKFGKVLGSGAGGSVRLMKRSSDGVTFAVKEFRARHTYESEKEYGKKVTAEFCIGSSLHHCNIIETLDIVNEKGKWYEVMEYAPFDLFAIVMTGKMSREEVTCSFLQILSGVTYLHSLGLAHRDMKLDNVVVNEFGIMKIIDFGSASVFQYPFENELVLAQGIVGSDPYLAPEVYDEKKYDPRPTDIWSLAIIYCCMTLRRFPWKLPRMTDNSFKLFASEPSPGTDIRRHSEPSTQTVVVAPPEQTQQTGGEEEKKPEVIKGPWRLLRLMPRESRHIIGRMLELDPKQRANMSEILADPWVAETPICHQLADGHGEVVRVPGHTHTLEPPTPPTTK